MGLTLDELSIKINLCYFTVASNWDDSDPAGEDCSFDRVIYYNEVTLFDRGDSSVWCSPAPFYHYNMPPTVAQDLCNVNVHVSTCIHMCCNVCIYTPNVSVCA